MWGDIISCPIYNQNLMDLLEDIDDKNDEETLDLMLKFAEKFTLLTKQRSELLRLANLCKRNLTDETDIFLYCTSYRCKNDIHIEWRDYKRIKTSLGEETSKNRFKDAEEALTFPHQWLKTIYKEYMKNAVKPASDRFYQNYRKMIWIYENMVKYENDNVEKWLYFVKQIDNKKAVKANLELKLGESSNWKFKKLWEFYFNFLKQNNSKEILEVFQKYTRLFISDKKAVKQYRNEIDKFSMWNEPTTKYWIDTIKYEMDFGEIKFAYKILERALKAVLGKVYHFELKDENDLKQKLKEFGAEMMEIETLRESSKLSDASREIKDTLSLKPTVYFKNPKMQNLCFHRSFIQNLLKTADPLILRKLYSSCKFFYSLQNMPLCYKLVIDDNMDTNYCEESLFVREKDVDFGGIDNLHIYDSFDVRNCNSRNIVSAVLPKLKRCDVSFMWIEKQDFSILEFKVMLSENIFQIRLYDVNIIAENGKNNDAKETYEILKSYPSLDTLEFYNNDFYIAASSSNEGECVKWMDSEISNFFFVTIYIENQKFSTSHLQRLIHFNRLKHITLKGVKVLNGAGAEMNKEYIKEFIKERVNPKNKIVIEFL